MRGQRLRIVPVMPPLLEEEKQKLGKGPQAAEYMGSAGELLTQFYFSLNSINTAEPKVDCGADLLVEKGPNDWKRAQVKKVIYDDRPDFKYNQRHGTNITRDNFVFLFQGSGGSGRKQRTIHDIDLFYHVLITKHRCLIFETPASVIPLREGTDGEFVQRKAPTLDRNSWVRKRPDIDFGKNLVYSHFDPIIFRKYPDFHLFNEPAPTLFDLIGVEE
jgi:hypothetical protein